MKLPGFTAGKSLPPFEGGHLSGAGRRDLASTDPAGQALVRPMQDESEGTYEWYGSHYAVAPCPKTIASTRYCQRGIYGITETTTCTLTKGYVYERFSWFSGWDLVQRCEYTCRGRVCGPYNTWVDKLIAR